MNNEEQLNECNCPFDEQEGHQGWCDSNKPLFKKDDKYCNTCKAIMGDGHDCDNCSYCGTDL